MLVDVGSLLNSLEEQVRAASFLSGVFRSVWAVRELFGREASMRSLQTLITRREITRPDAIAIVSALDNEANFTCATINATEKKGSPSFQETGCG